MNCQYCGKERTIFNTHDHQECEIYLSAKGRTKTKAEKARDKWDHVRYKIAPVIFARDGRKCSACGCVDNLTIDHIIPLSRGGNNDLNNLCVLCHSCNSKKRAK